MARDKPIDRSPKLVPVDLDAQIQALFTQAPHLRCPGPYWAAHDRH